MSDITITENPIELAKELGPAGDARVGPHVGVATIALNMAMKYHDISTVQDGTLYQQYKLEGRNMAPLHLDMVFETAIHIERHLVKSNERIMLMLLDQLTELSPDDAEKDKPQQPADLGEDADPSAGSGVPD